MPSFSRIFSIFNLKSGDNLFDLWNLDLEILTNFANNGKKYRYHLPNLFQPEVKRILSEK